MKRTKLTALLLTFAMVLSLALAGCNSNGTTSTPADSNPAASSTGAASSGATADMTQAAEQLLVDLKGTYEELWPVILDSKYDQTWLDDCKAVVGGRTADEDRLHGQADRSGSGRRLHQGSRQHGVQL